MSCNSANGLMILYAVCYMLSLCGDGISALKFVQLSHDGCGVVLKRPAACASKCFHSSVCV